MYQISPNNPLPDQFHIVECSIRMVANGVSVCAAISGACGLGKTYRTIRALSGLGVRHEVFRGTGAALIAKAYEFREGGVLVLDDADNLVMGGGVTQSNIMKMLFAPDPKGRTIVYDTKAARANAASDDRDPAIPPPRFVTKCGIVWITNANLAKPSEVDPKMRPHINALIDRGLDTVRLSDDHVHKLEYILWLATEGGLLQSLSIPRIGGSFKLSIEAINDVLEFFIKNAWHFKTLSIRRLEKIAALRGAEPDNWLKIASADLLARPLYRTPLPTVIKFAPHRLRLVAQ